MSHKNLHITQLIDDGLRDAIQRVRVSQGSSKQGDDFHFKRIVFSQKHNLVVVEIGGEQSRNLSELSIAANMLQESNFSSPYFSRVDIMELEENTYLYFWVTSNEQFEAENLAYAN